MTNQIIPQTSGITVAMALEKPPQIGIDATNAEKSPPPRLQQAFCKVGNSSVKPIWHKIEGACKRLQVKLAYMLSRLAQRGNKQPSPVPVGGKSAIEDLISQPDSYQVLPPMVLRLITSGTIESNVGVGNSIKRHLETYPNSRLFSRENITLRADNGVLKLTFTDPKDLPRVAIGQGYELILDKRLNTPSDFDGSRIVELLKNREFEFDNLNDFCRKMTMCEHLNFTQITTAQALAISLTNDPENKIIKNINYKKQLDMLVSMDKNTGVFHSNLVFDSVKGINYWKSTAAKNRVANRLDPEQKAIISASLLKRQPLGRLELPPLTREGDANVYQPVYPQRTINRGAKPAIPPKPPISRVDDGILP